LANIAPKAFKVYSKAAPDATYEELEQAFRLNNLNTYLIATVSQGIQPLITFDADAKSSRKKSYPRR